MFKICYNVNVRGGVGVRELNERKHASAWSEAKAVAPKHPVWRSVMRQMRPYMLDMYDFTLSAGFVLFRRYTYGGSLLYCTRCQ